MLFERKVIPGGSYVEWSVAIIVLKIDSVDSRRWREEGSKELRVRMREAHCQV